VTPPKLIYFSDVLCIWAYAAQIRLDEVADQFGDQIWVSEHFCSVFGDAHSKVAEKWKDRGGFDGFNAHLAEVASGFPHIKLNKDVWRNVRPQTSTSAHVFLKAVQIIDKETPSETAFFQAATWAIRSAFFEHGRDISDWDVRRQIANDLDMDFERIESKIKSSEAISALDADHKLSHELGIIGSPTFVMNQARQKLYGNVGYLLIKANLEEMLRNPTADEASWC